MSARAEELEALEVSISKEREDFTPSLLLPLVAVLPYAVRGDIWAMLRWEIDYTVGFPPYVFVVWRSHCPLSRSVGTRSRATM